MRFAKRRAHKHGIDGLCIGTGIIGRAQSGLGKAAARIKRARGGVVSGNLKESVRRGLRGLHHPVSHQPASDALALMGGIDGDGQQFGLARDHAHKGKSVRCCAGEHMRAVQKAGEFSGGPGACVGEGSGVNLRHVLRGHEVAVGNMTGGTSRPGAASAGRR